MNRDLLEVLVHCSAELQKAHRIAIDAGRTDIAGEIWPASIDIADAIAMTVPDRAGEEAS